MYVSLWVNNNTAPMSFQGSWRDSTSSTGNKASPSLPLTVSALGQSHKILLSNLQA